LAGRGERAADRPRLPRARQDRPQSGDPACVAAAGGPPRRGRHPLQEGDRDPAARRLQHARQPVRVPGRARCRTDRGRPLRRLQPDERRLRARPARDGRAAPGRDEAAVPAALARAGDQLGAADHAPPELPRAAAGAPFVPARRAPVTTPPPSRPEVRRPSATLAAGRHAAEIGTLYGDGAEAIAATAASLVTIEPDPELAATARGRLPREVEVVCADWRVLLERDPFEFVF